MLHFDFPKRNNLRRRGGDQWEATPKLCLKYQLCTSSTTMSFGKYEILYVNPYGQLEDGRPPYKCFS